MVCSYYAVIILNNDKLLINALNCSATNTSLFTLPGLQCIILPLFVISSSVNNSYVGPPLTKYVLSNYPLFKT